MDGCICCLHLLAIVNNAAVSLKVHISEILSSVLLYKYAEKQDCWIIMIVLIVWHFIPIQKKGNAKECSNYCTVALISHTSKVMLKILQARLQQYVNHELPDVQAGFRKGRGTRDQIANICWIIEKAREFQKKHLLLLY